ncbi:hypothetical protein PR048_031972 [Dryococelus australis]|uniref:HAT C-terminal dimerisation domain-containing protein n=1 Tax=Dryococelus australis TaxID=614101 RepID=A0ABQ9G6T8_9NEOP|nr:hypothetical protein PR048_031972 [Dryococelus australis]
MMTVRQVRATSYDFWNHHKKLPRGKTKSKKERDDELSVYLGNTVTPLSSGAIIQWEDMKTVFPSLYKEALKYLCIMTSVPTERLFSKARVILDKDRNYLLGNRKEKLLILSD